MEHWPLKLRLNRCQMFKKKICQKLGIKCMLLLINDDVLFLFLLTYVHLAPVEFEVGLTLPV